MQVNVGHSLTYLGLSYNPLPSPDGKNLVMVAEDRYGDRGSEFSLHLCTMKLDGKVFFTQYALTPRYKEVVDSPDGKIIAFVEVNMVSTYGVHFYLPKEGNVDYAQAYYTGNIDRFQFSKDQKYYRYRQTSGHRFETLKENLGAAIRGPKWRINHTISRKGHGPVFKKDGNLSWTEEETNAFAEWAPIEKPKVVPQFLKQPMPKITQDTQDRMQWSPDSKYLYLFDKKGLWRCEVGNSHMPRWTKLVNAPGIVRFQLSSTGTALVYEVILKDPSERTSTVPDPGKMERVIWYLNLEKINVEMEDRPAEKPEVSEGDWLLDATPLLSPQKIASGWGATFHPNGKILFYANLDGAHRLILPTMEFERYLSMGWWPR